jgi:hypothetical protein
MNLIYQYWDGKMLPGHFAGREAMENYAHSIGADYIFEHNPRWQTALGQYSPHYGSFKFVYDGSFDIYDNILYADIDIFPVDGLTENIFDGFTAELGICTEPMQPKFRSSSITPGGITGRNDEVWAKMIRDVYGKDMPRDSDGLLKVYNSGLVLWSRTGIIKGRESLPVFKEYIQHCRETGLPSFYTADQNYIHAAKDIIGLDWIELDNGWNSYIHYHGEGNPRPVNDTRTKDTKFVHVQLRAADHFDQETLHTIVNNPVGVWNGKLPQIG